MPNQLRDFNLDRDRGWFEEALYQSYFRSGGNNVALQGNYIAFKAYECGVHGATIQASWKSLSETTKERLRKGFIEIGKSKLSTDLAKENHEDRPIQEMNKDLKSDFIRIMNEVRRSWGMYFNEKGEFEDEHGWGEGRNIYAENLLHRRLKKE